MEQPPELNAAPPLPSTKQEAIAPVWHTVVFLAVFFALSLPLAHKAGQGSSDRNRTAMYLSTMVMEWLYVAYILWGLRLRGRRLRDVIGGRWNSVESVITDLVLGACFFLVNIFLRAIILVPLFALNKDLKASADETFRVVKMIGPGTAGELLLFLALALTAGICEEIMFRGYLQQQIRAWTQSTAVAVVLSTVAFALGHAYQGWFGVLVVASYGITLAILAEWRHSLRPGMIAHTWQDVVAGLLTHLLARSR